MLGFPEENIRRWTMHVEFVQVFPSCENVIVSSFSQLGVSLNLADMFHFFVLSQHPLSAYCWARQEPRESWSKLLNAGVYRRDNTTEAQSLTVFVPTVMLNAHFFIISHVQNNVNTCNVKMYWISPNTHICQIICAIIATGVSDGLIRTMTIITTDKHKSIECPFL